MKKIIALLTMLLLVYSVVPLQSQQRLTYPFIENVLEKVNYLILRNSQGILSVQNNFDSTYTLTVTKYDSYTRTAIVPDSTNISLKKLIAIRNKLTADLATINIAIKYLSSR